jgi:hypothetical protein
MKDTRTELSFLSVRQETVMLSMRVGIHPAAAKLMVEFANLTRQNADEGKLTMGVTTRRLLAWARTVRVGIASKEAFQSAVINRAAPEDRATLQMLEGQTLRSLHPKIDGIVRGTIDPDAPVIDPEVPVIEPTAQGPVGATALQRFGSWISSAWLEPKSRR